MALTDAWLKANDVLATKEKCLIDEFATLIPESLRNRSGSVFHSGRAAFSSPSPLYILGLNPGGSATEMDDFTVDRHTARVLTESPHEWSEYVDERWQGATAGTSKMQPRVRHTLEQVGLDPR